MSLSFVSSSVGSTLCRGAGPQKRRRCAVGSGVRVGVCEWVRSSVLRTPRQFELPKYERIRIQQAVSSRVAVKASLLGSISSVASTGAGVLVLGFIIFVHETGHFLAARLQNIKVDNFSIGFGPTLFKYRPNQSDTEFTLRALPLGGFVAFPDHITVDEETGKETVNTDPDFLQNRPLRDRAIVISAGVVANILLAWTSIFASVSTVGVPEYSFNPGVVISNLVDENGAGAKAGVLSGDIIVKVDGQPVPQSVDSASEIATKIRTSKGRLLNFRIQRAGREFDLKVRPKCCSPDGDAAMGVQLVPNATVTRARPPSLLATIGTTNSEFSRLTKQTYNGLTSIFLNFRQSARQLAGPIGVVSMGADLARNDTAALLTFCAVISINLALINALPLPALDGGQMVFLIIEALRGAPLSLRFQDAVNRTALLLFLAFSGVLFFGDLEKLKILSAIQKLFG